MVSKKNNTIARLTLKFQLEPSKYIQMSFSRVNPGSDLAEVGHRIAAVTDYRDCPVEMSTDIA